jgi:acetyl esterase/lipase
VLAWAVAGRAAEKPKYTRLQDVVYGRKDGTALTLDVFTPKDKKNGAGVIFVVSGGWFSSHDAIFPGLGLFNEYLKRGYTVFTVVHGSQPRYTIPDAVGDLNRAVRFIRYHAKDYKIDPKRLGITGLSAGGHLSLMQGMAGTKGNPEAKDPVERVSSRVQAVACFFPPTDFLNYGKAGKDVFEHGVIQKYKLQAPFEFRKLDPVNKVYLPVKDKKKVRKILREMSPLYHVSAKSPPSLIIHGTKDSLVPYQQAKAMVAKLTKAHVPAKLITKKDADHGWPGMDKDIVTCADWFDKYLKKAPQESKE